ncbi:DUF4400 domain-containing protein (plasmid) [Pararobbsia alpina]|uniref:DUF4400 domain-containing protein n=1 Tax=Pararobbsia alpina TaxID=621374 RepID=UPI0039A6EBD4
MASRFASHLKLWFFVVPLLTVAILPAIPDDGLFNIGAPETQSASIALGADRANEAMTVTNRHFRTWFIDTGYVGKSFAGIASNEFERHADAGVSELGATWVKHLWLLVFRALYRLNVLSAWMCGLCIFAGAMWMDGAARRKIKASAAGYSSPLSFHVAWHGLFLATGALIWLLLAPVPLIFNFASLFVALFGALIWKAAESYRSTGT